MTNTLVDQISPELIQKSLNALISDLDSPERFKLFLHQLGWDYSGDEVPDWASIKTHISRLESDLVNFFDESDELQNPRGSFN